MVKEHQWNWLATGVTTHTPIRHSYNPVGLTLLILEVTLVGLTQLLDNICYNPITHVLFVQTLTGSPGHRR